jgi:hypothetical protein
MSGNREARGNLIKAAFEAGYYLPTYVLTIAKCPVLREFQLYSIQQLVVIHT